MKDLSRTHEFNTRTFLVLVFSLQIAYLGAFSAEKLNVSFSTVLVNILGILYLLFVPGYLILRILGISRVTFSEMILYSLGLSLFFDMCLGLFINFAYPFLGLTELPLTESSIVITFLMSTFLLTIFSYLASSNSTFSYKVSLEIPHKTILFSSILLPLSILGTYMVNTSHNNILLLGTIILIAGIILAITFTKTIPTSAYSYVIFVIAISLIFHTTLITNYIQVQDVYGEYYIAQHVLETCIWEYYVSDTPYNSVLSTTILPVIFHYISKMSLTWVYKIVFPTFLAFIPIILYRIYTLYVAPKVAFLSVVLFMGIHSFFITIPFIPKQVTAEVFLLLLLHVALFRKVGHRDFLLTVFGIAIVMSHYGTAYLVLGMLLFVKIWEYLTSVLSKSKTQKNTLSSRYMALYAAVVFAWYSNVSGMISLSNILERAVSIARLIASGILFNANYSRGASLLTKQLPLLGTLDKFLYFAIGILSAVGLFVAIINTYTNSEDVKRSKFDTMYLAFSVYWMVILGATILIPHFAVMNPYRLYHLSMITLSPFVMYGLYKILTVFSNFIKIDYLKIAGVVIAVFILLNTGALNEILRLPPFYSSSLNQNTALQFGSIEDKRMVYGRLITTYDVQSSAWISNFWNSSRLIYSNKWGYGSASLHSYGGLPLDKIDSIPSGGTVPKNNYVYIPYIFKEFRLWYTVDILGQPKYFNATSLYMRLVVEYSLIYDNHGTQVLLS